jgi:hypothetical protein
MAAELIEQTEEPTAVVRSWTLHDVEVLATVAKLQDINARAAKKGLDGLYTWEVGEETKTPVYAGGHTQPNFPGEEPLYFEVTYPFTVHGGAPKLAGWKFIATLTWDGVLVTRTHPAFEGRIDESTLRERWCDHCRTERNRIDTYLLEHADGRRVQVGSNCIKDFLGHSFSPSWLRSTDSDMGELEKGFGRYEAPDADTLAVLTWAESLVRVTGWVSVAKAEAECRIPTSAILKAILFTSGDKCRQAVLRPGMCDCSNCLRQRYQPTEDNAAEAVKVLAWARAIEPGSSEYLANVRRLAHEELIGRRNAGILGSAVASYWREHNERVERATRPVSQHVGAVKQRLELVLTVRTDTTIDGDWGVSHLYTLTDADGNVFKWFSSRRQNWAIGQEVKVKATVKAHEAWHDTKQTVITRCTEI